MVTQVHELDVEVIPCREAVHDPCRDPFAEAPFAGGAGDDLDKPDP